ncbi:hypothetical protein Tco_1064682 [Tanacetum coccineum]
MVWNMETGLLMKKHSGRFIDGLHRQTCKNVIAANPARIQDAIRIAKQMKDKKGPRFIFCKECENKRGMESNLGITG